eukprot:scaffold2594_cov54-Phaeocystis_antarctica.AAC.1
MELCAAWLPPHRHAQTVPRARFSHQPLALKLGAQARPKPARTTSLTAPWPLWARRAGFLRGRRGRLVRVRVRLGFG